MSQNEAPTAPLSSLQLVDPRTGMLTQQGQVMLDTIWRQVAAGFTVTPCKVDQTNPNLLLLTPRLHDEGARTYGDGMAYSFVAAAASTGTLNAKVGKLSTVPVRKNNGGALAGSGDVQNNFLYLLIYHGNLNCLVLF